MASPQTSVVDPGLGYEGQLATMGDNVVFTRKNGTGAAIPFGRFVTDDGSVTGGFKLPGSGSDKIRGILLAEPATEVDANGKWQCQDGSLGNLATHATVWMIPEVDMVRADPVYARFTVDGGDAALTPGRLCKADQAGAAGTQRVQSITLSGALDAGQARIQKLVLSADLAAVDSVAGTIGGQAIAGVTYATSHSLTMLAIVKAIKDALETSGQVYGDVVVTGATSREIHITGLKPSPTDLALTAWVCTNGGAGTAQFTSTTGADVQAGKNPHSLSIVVDGGGAISAAWEGTGDATLAALAAIIAQQAGVASAIVTKVSDSSNPDDADRVIKVTSTAKSPTSTVLTSPTVTGGANARTAAVADVVAGVADGAAAKAGLVSGARLIDDALAGTLAKVYINL